MFVAIEHKKKARMFLRLIRFGSYCFNVQGSCKIENYWLTISAIKSLQWSCAIFVSFASFASFSVPLYFLMCLLGLDYKSEYTVRIWCIRSFYVPKSLICCDMWLVFPGWFIILGEGEIFFVQDHWISQEWRIKWKLKVHYLLNFKTLRISRETYSICISCVYNFPCQNVFLLSSEIPRISVKSFKGSSFNCVIGNCVLASKWGPVSLLSPPFLNSYLFLSAPNQGI